MTCANLVKEVNMELEVEYNNDVEVEIGKNLFWFDGPIGRFRFFVISLLGLISVFAIVFTHSFIIPFIQSCPAPMIGFLIVLMLIYYWVFFVAVSKRLYDITGSLKKGIIIAVVLSTLNLLFNVIMLIAMIALMFIPGKMIKSDY